jgi:hypothetical protein
LLFSLFHLSGKIKENLTLISKDYGKKKCEGCLHDKAESWKIFTTSTVKMKAAIQIYNTK